MSGSESNQWQCTKLFIDLHFVAKTYQSASTDARVHTGAGIKRNEHQGPGHGGRAEVKEEIVHYRKGEETCGAPQKGERNLPTV